jgi:hypothetical protein
LLTNKIRMNISTTLKALFDRIPRRHNADNVKEINSILTEYEDVLIEIEAINGFYEKAVPSYFDAIENIKETVKNSNSSKASKKGKDDLFDDASCALKDSIEAVIELYGDGKKTA